MRAPLSTLALCLVALAGCDAVDDPCARLVQDGPNAQIRAPEYASTIRLGEPFAFRATYETGFRADSVRAGVIIGWGLPFEDIRPLYREVLDVRRIGEGEYTVEATVTADEWEGGVSLADLDPEAYFVVGAYAEEVYSCPGVGGGGAGAASYTEVTLEE